MKPLVVVEPYSSLPISLMLYKTRTLHETSLISVASCDHKEMSQFGLIMNIKAILEIAQVRLYALHLKQPAKFLAEPFSRIMETSVALYLPVLVPMVLFQFLCLRLHLEKIRRAHLEVPFKLKISVT